MPKPQNNLYAKNANSFNSTLNNTSVRYSLDLDPEFKELLERMSNNRVTCSDFSDSRNSDKIIGSFTGEKQSSFSSNSTDILFDEKFKVVDGEKDCNDVNSCDEDLNKTFSIKTLDHQRMTQMFTALEDDDEGGPSFQQIEKNQKIKSEYNAKMCMPENRVDPIVQSPHTPQNKNLLKLPRSFRIGNITNRSPDMR